MYGKDRKNISDLHFILLQSVSVQQAGGGLGVVGQFCLCELGAERLQGLSRGLHHEGECLDCLRRRGRSGTVPSFGSENMYLYCVCVCTYSAV